MYNKMKKNYIGIEKSNIIHKVCLQTVLWETIADKQCGIKNIVNSVIGTVFLQRKDSCNILSLYSSKEIISIFSEYI